MLFLGPLIVIGTLALGLRLALGAIGDAVCADYNSLSNDFCDRWHFDPPPEESFPKVPGWTIESSQLDCGSGGCPTRTYVLSTELAYGDPAAAWADEIEALGWSVAEGTARGPDYLVARKDDLQMLVKGNGKRFVDVTYSIVGEAGTYN